MIVPKTRSNARVLLVDENDRLLMIRVLDDGVIVVPDSPVPAEFWVLPGGGLDPGETPEAAARREIFEETGITDFELDARVYEQHREIVWAGEPMHAITHYFAGRVNQDGRAAVGFDHIEDAEREVFLEHRWWSLPDMLASTTECFRPPGVEQLFAAGLAEQV